VLAAHLICPHAQMPPNWEEHSCWRATYYARQHKLFYITTSRTEIFPSPGAQRNDAARLPKFSIAAGRAPRRAHPLRHGPRRAHPLRSTLHTPIARSDQPVPSLANPVLRLRWPRGARAADCSIDGRCLHRAFRGCAASHASPPPLPCTPRTSRPCGAASPRHAPRSTTLRPEEPPPCTAVPAASPQPPSRPTSARRT
jgi:hypothetical protein